MCSSVPGNSFGYAASFSGSNTSLVTSQRLSISSGASLANAADAAAMGAYPVHRQMFPSNASSMSEHTTLPFLFRSSV